MRYYVVPAAQGSDQASRVKRGNAYRAALARDAEPGVLCETREAAQRLAEETERRTGHKWVVREANL